MGANESFFKFSNPANVAKSLLDGNRDHSLAAEARSELMKQEYKVESLNSCIHEFQQQTYAQRLELEDGHHGYVESRREQVRLQEELVMKESALRDTRIGSIHEMVELKRAQELRVDELSVQKLSHDTMQRLTSQLQELHERVTSGRLSHVPSQQAVIPSPRLLLSRDKRLPLDTRNLSWTTGKHFWQSTPYVRFITDTSSRNSSLYDSMCYRCGSSAGKYRATCRNRWRTKLGARLQCRCLKECRQPWILFC